MVRYYFAIACAFATLTVNAADWPQWRGPERDAKATGFKAPSAWPKELTKKWSVTVGNGVATPALVGDKLFVFGREGGDEVTRCLNTSDGKEVWVDKYAAAFRGSGDSGYPGPRSSPAVADGKVVTLGVNGTLSCLNAADGKKIWRKETGPVPMFHTSCSPLIVDKLVIVQIGSNQSGSVIAYEMADGKEKWKWSDEGTVYSSPVLMTVGDMKMVVAETAKSVVGIDLKEGKQLWKTAFAPTGRGYNASTPIVQGDTIIFSGSARGTKALKIEKKDDKFEPKELWSNSAVSVMYNSPILRDKLIFGLTSNDNLFSISAETGKTAWTTETKGRRGYGNVVDAGGVLVALTPVGQLIIYEPSDKAFKEVASYKVATSDTYAYPILDGNRVFVKDKDSVTLWTVE